MRPPGGCQCATPAAPRRTTPAPLPVARAVVLGGQRVRRYLRPTPATRAPTPAILQRAERWSSDRWAARPVQRRAVRRRFARHQRRSEHRPRPWPVPGRAAWRRVVRWCQRYTTITEQVPVTTTVRPHRHRTGSDTVTRKVTEMVQESGADASDPYRSPASDRKSAGASEADGH